MSNPVQHGTRAAEAENQRPLAAPAWPESGNRARRKWCPWELRLASGQNAVMGRARQVRLRPDSKFSISLAEAVESGQNRALF